MRAACETPVFVFMGQYPIGSVIIVKRLAFADCVL
jgi:hypothetical protein